MEKYFYNVSQEYYKGIVSPDIHPENSFQNGATPEFKEKARNHCDRFRSYPDKDKPISECPPVYDSKWRFFWNIGETDPKQNEGMLVFDHVIPKSNLEIIN